MLSQFWRKITPKLQLALNQALPSLIDLKSFSHFLKPQPGSQGAPQQTDPHSPHPQIAQVGQVWGKASWLPPPHREPLWWISPLWTCTRPPRPSPPPAPSWTRRTSWRRVSNEPPQTHTGSHGRLTSSLESQVANLCLHSDSFHTFGIRGQCNRLPPLRGRTWCRGR